MEFKRFLIQILFEKGSETSSRLICSCFQKTVIEYFLLLYVLGLLLHFDASMQQLDIPVIVICIFFYKRVFIQNLWCLSFFPLLCFVICSV